MRPLNVPLCNHVALLTTHVQVDKDTTKLAYMRAAMTSLAYVHGITFSFMKVLDSLSLSISLKIGEYLIFRASEVRSSFWQNSPP